MGALPPSNLPRKQVARAKPALERDLTVCALIPAARIFSDTRIDSFDGGQHPGSVDREGESAYCKVLAV
jgi:hypothetical protein